VPHDAKDNPLEMFLNNFWPGSGTMYRPTATTEYSSSSSSNTMDVVNRTSISTAAVSTPTTLTGQTGKTVAATKRMVCKSVPLESVDRDHESLPMRRICYRVSDAAASSSAGAETQKRHRRRHRHGLSTASSSTTLRP